MLTAQEIRSRFLNFFIRREHHLAASGSLIPAGDPTLLFTNAGMVQFKQLFLGEEKQPWNRAVSCQKCLRVSGKHNDLENVGRTARHHTFFEMLGNFSFGNYFKKEAITWAWEFVTEELKLPKDKLWVTIFRDDNEAATIWRDVIGLPEERIVRMGEKDNFWTMGDTGPCGPCSEIYIDQGEDMSCGSECGIGKCDCDRFLEIWNLVFTQFDQNANGIRTLLAAPNIDTGMGLERIAAVCQGQKSNFDCDLFQEIILYIADIAKVTYSHSAPDTNDIDTALRVIADHTRAAAFLIAEGILPSNEGRGYVLRRLIRRALRFATLMGVHEPFMYRVTGKVADVMGDAYPELKEHIDFIKKVVFEEERRFALTLDNGLHMLEEEFIRLSSLKEKEISGDICFKLYDTFGFPLDIIADVAEKRGFIVDSKGFQRCMADQRQRARDNQKRKGLFGHGDANELTAVCKTMVEDGKVSKFVGYDTLELQSEIIELLDEGGVSVSRLGEGATGYLISRETPFYAESGGQVGDVGIIMTDSAKLEIRNVIKPYSSIIVHEVIVEAGEIHKDQSIFMQVNANSRKDTARNHTCVHLLHASLRRILGDHVKQAGSLVDAKRLRFDFSHIASLTKEQLAEVEQDVNRAILADFPVCAVEMKKEEAINSGAIALFSEKYGEIVRVLKIGNDNQQPESVELCGGTHLSRTGEAGSFYILSESAVAAGVRRIEALSGWNAYNFAISQRSDMRQASEILRTRPEQLVQKCESLREEMKKLRKAANTAVSTTSIDLSNNVEKIKDVSLLTKSIENLPQKVMREMMDQLRNQFPSRAVICLASPTEDKISFLLYVAKDLHNVFTAPDLIRIAAELCGGAGGGRADLAQAGGSKPQVFKEVFMALKEHITSSL